jgi:tricarballylate dehydrogenase
LIAPGVANNQGDGIRMAGEVGAAMSGQFDGIHAEAVDRRTDRADAVLYAHPWTVIVNDDAERFYDEGALTFDASFELIAYKIWAEQNNSAYYITDQTVMDNAAITGMFDTDVPPVKADTIAELAVALGLGPDALEKTINEYNKACPPGEFNPAIVDGRSTTGLTPPKSNWAHPLDNPPYYAYPVMGSVCFTYGGVRTDTNARVLSGSGFPIPGLYAAGELVGLFYYEYVAATSVLKALTFGRIAGAHAAERRSPVAAAAV